MPKLSSLQIIGKKIVIDTGPLANLLGCYDKDGKFDKNMASNIVDSGVKIDFYEHYGESLLKLLGKNRLIITPHVLAETSGKVKNANVNLEEILGSKNLISRMLKDSQYDEHHEDLKELLCKDTAKYINEGITDCAVMSIAKSVKFLLTDDNKLISISRKIGIKAITPQEWVHGAKRR